jgi:TonB-linked SusC/RagA family outer membrane protein
MAQSRTIKGIVKDDKGLTLPGVSVTEKGSKNSTATDENGGFTIAVKPNSILVFTSVGYTSSEVAVGSKTELTVQLKEDITTLNDVVVVGYGTQKKISMTGAVETISSKAFENRPVTSAVQLLQGASASLVVSTPAGGNTPGSRPTITIRGQAALTGGATEPLVVIDGIPSSVDDYNTLNPNVIESISVLKDAASSAIYGARAPYGVLVVTTKMGKKNEKPVITYSGNTGIVFPVRTPNTADSYSFALSRNQAQLNGAAAPYFSTAQLDIIKDNIDNPGKYTLAQLNPVINGAWPGANNSYNNVDMMDVWLKPSMRQQHDLSVRGGGEKTNYFVSAAFVNQPGNLNYIEDIDNFKRYNLNSGLVAEINDWLKLTYRTRYALSQSIAPMGEFASGRDRIYAFAYGAWPTMSVMLPTGEYGSLPRISTSIGAGDSRLNTHNLDNILALDMKLAKGWTAHVDGDWRIAFNDRQDLRIPVYETGPTGVVGLIPGTESSLAKSNTLSTYWTLQGWSAYEHSLDKHNFRLQLGVSAEESNARQLSGTTRDLIDPQLPAVAISTGTRTLNDAINTWATQGFFGKFNYDYDNKYLFQVTGRYDGSGRYSEDSRWGFFPSVSAGWNISRENFWEKIAPVVNYAKLRGSYGTVGNQGNSAGYLHIPTMSVGAQSPWIFNGARLPYVNTPGILNMERTWEKLTEYDIALELGLLNNRLTAEFDYYNRDSWDIIGPATPLPAVLGTGAPEINNAAFVTKGFDLTIKWSDNINKDWNYSVAMNLGDNHSEITKYNTTLNSIGSGAFYVGKQIGEIWGYTANRFLNAGDFDAAGKLLVDQSQFNARWFAGDMKYEDLNGDGKINNGTATVGDSGDQRRIGNSTPRYNYGVNLATGYNLKSAGRLDLSIFIQGVGKRDVFMGSSYYYWGAVGTGTSAIETTIYKGQQMDYYRDEKSDPRVLAVLGQNTDSYFPRPYGNSGEGAKNFQSSTKYLLSGAYTRLKNVQLNYSLPQEVLKTAKINNCSLYVSGENLFVLSKLPSYIDPEFVNGGRAYPQTAVFSMGVNIGF